MPIKRGADLYRREGRRNSAEAILDLVRERGGIVSEPTGITAGTNVVAYINHGRWLGDCGLYDAARDRICNNSQLVDEDDQRFFCVVCNNADIDGNWRAVTWPADPETIEGSLEGLPTNEQNWTPS